MATKAIPLDIGGLLNGLFYEGVPISGGSVYVKTKGGGSDADVWEDEDKSSAAANPFDLDANGAPDTSDVSGGVPYVDQEIDVEVWSGPGATGTKLYDWPNQNYTNPRLGESDMTDLEEHLTYG